MTRPADELLARLRFLSRVVGKECEHLEGTARRLFSDPFGVERAQQLDSNLLLAERCEAFVGRFGRLQDTLGDKMLPSLLTAMGFVPGAPIDNFDQAERLGWLTSADDGVAARRLRHRMVDEYVEDPLILADALTTANALVPMLTSTARRMPKELDQRGWR